MTSQTESFLDIFNSIDFEKIKDHPNILIAANFWEKDRFCAAKTCYRFMRAIDDMIDEHKARNKEIDPSERHEFVASVEQWLKMTIMSEECNPLQEELTETFIKFRIPLWPMEAFAKSMIYDINNDGFSSLDAFLEYSGGASVAPASIFVHLNGLLKKDGTFIDPPFDVKRVATPCAVFSYLVHIIRDFQKDQMNNLSYFADDLILKHGLSRQILREIAEGRPVNQGFRNLIREYMTVADRYRHETYDMIREISPLLEPRYQLSLCIIFELYLMVYERIDFENGSFTTAELNPSPAETRQRVYETIMKFRQV
ncbi:MAG: squalene/phytoene synthase family protein [Bacteroidales bacterium]|jgi:phytoene/squalene synthetase|nr:squalene/phytoene synthase family protein [Bacteroidales bacterium]MCU0408018.1 squalene/phytoene synthase family protein [Bacteroidales bacterium]